MDPVTLAGSAVAPVAPYPVEGGKELAKKVATRPLSGYLGCSTSSNRRPPGRELPGVADFEPAPGVRKQATLRHGAEKALEADPAFRAELEKLVGELQAMGGVALTKLIANVTGISTSRRRSPARGTLCAEAAVPARAHGCGRHGGRFLSARLDERAARVAA